VGPETRSRIMMKQNAAGQVTCRVFSSVEGAYQRKGLQVAFKINDECVSCGSCKSECPVEAIKEGEGKYVIDTTKCTDCGSCAEVCPVECISQG
jgi:ferredoxin